MTEKRQRRRGRGEGGITQLPDGRWQARIDLGWVNGRRRRKVFYAKTRREAAALLNRAIAQREQGLPVLNERQTVGQFLERWLEVVAKPTVRTSTYVSYASHTRNHLIPGLGKRPLARLTPQEVQAFLKGKLDEGLSPRTVQYVRAILRRALGHALKWNLVARNAAALTSPPKVHRREVEPLTREQARAFLDGLHGDRLEAMYSVAVALGLRQGEILGLSWKDIDLENGSLTVRHALQRVGGKPTLVPPKTRGSQRTLWLPAFSVAALRQHKVRQLAERLQGGPCWQDWGLVFTTPVGTPLDASNVTHTFQKTLGRLGLPRQRFHDLRHCCASLLLAQGLTLKDVMETLGHSQVSLTANLYGHLYAEQRKEVAQRMDALLGARAERA